MKFHFVLSGLALAGLSLTVSAQTLSPPKESSLTLGGGLGFGPRFMGSTRSQAVVLPLLDYQHQSGFFASTQRGLGWTGGKDAFTYGLAGPAQQPDHAPKDPAGRGA